MNEQILLRMKNISKTFLGVKALKNIDFELRAGEIHALLGENGAGKSTLIKVLGGIYIPEAGKIYIDGQQAEINDVKDAQAHGIAIIHQELMLVPYMTVAENIFLGREMGKGVFVNRNAMTEAAQELLDAHNVQIKADALLRDLTIAQQQMVEIIKAISQNSRILVMDEPTSSISDNEVNFLFKTMRTLKEQGVGIIYISHKMSELEEICDRVTVLRDGESISTRVVGETNKGQLIAMMVGRELTKYYTRDYLEPGKVVMKVDGLSDGKLVRDVSFTLHKGEILGFSGLVGAGRSELVKIIFGLSKKTGGTIQIDGQPVEIRTPMDALARGIALVPENRKVESLYKVQTVRFNSTIEILDQFIHGIFVNRGKEEAVTQKYIDMMDTKTPSQEQVIGNLSGGNQQKVIIGRWLATAPKILILDEPTRGVDVGAKSEIYAIMNELIKEGMSIIMISSELPEIINMSDRVCVMRNGKIRGVLNHTEAVQENIMKLAAK